MISTRTVIGSIGILANHEPLLAMLDPTELRLYRSDDDIVRFAQGEGDLQMIDNHALILVEEAVDPGTLDAGDPRRRRVPALDAPAGCPPGVAPPAPREAFRGNPRKALACSRVGNAVRQT